MNVVQFFEFMEFHEWVQLWNSKKDMEFQKISMEFHKSFMEFHNCMTFMEFHKSFMEFH